MGLRCLDRSDEFTLPSMCALPSWITLGLIQIVGGTLVRHWETANRS